jgi:hypothetical protein
VDSAAGLTHDLPSRDVKRETVRRPSAAAATVAVAPTPSAPASAAVTVPSAAERDVSARAVAVGQDDADIEALIQKRH